MKLITILGTRPEIIRLSRIIEKMDKICEHVIIHTGQNYDLNLNEIFFKQLNLRAPDYYLNAKGSFGEQISIIFKKTEQIFEKEKPDRFLVLGDTNSSLGAIIAKRMNIPVYHMEAGNRCYNERVPEEVNRRIIDHSSDILLPYTERSRKNLLSEGIPGEKIYVTGNPINEVLNYYMKKVDGCKAFEKYNVKSKNFFLVTCHRAENVDVDDRLNNFITSLNLIERNYKMPIIWSMHPRTRQRFKKGNYKLDSGIDIVDPIGLFEFVKLEKNASCVITDSGTVQEECCIFKVPNVTVRDETERPETIEVGSNVLAGMDPQSILKCVDIVMNRSCDWEPPVEYLKKDVSSTIVKVVLGHYHL
jgi:UDP-N-acetylglucosamine 2-epimerase (non-hydrolysing)